MGPQQIVAWTEQNFKLGDRRRSIALGEFAWALISAGTVSIAAIGRKVVGVATEASKIARVFNFCHNLKIDPLVVQRALFRILVSMPVVGKVVGSMRHVLLSIDWHQFDHGEESSLRISLMVGSRAIPLLWFDVKTSELKGRQRAIEDQAVEELVRLQPVGVLWVLLLDAGFRCSKRMQRMKEVFKFIQRTNCRDKVHGEHLCWTEPRHLGVQAGQVVDFGWVDWSCNDPVQVRLVATYVKAPQKRKPRRASTRHKSRRQDEAWYLLTNLDAVLFPALQVVVYYARRFECEHNFRDIKNASLGLDMEHVHLLTAPTYERLMCIVAVASALLWLFGAEAEAKGWATRLSPSRPKKPRRILSLVNVGKLMARKIRCSIRSLIQKHLLPALAAVHSHIGPGWIHPQEPYLTVQGAVWCEQDMHPIPRSCRTHKKKSPCLAADIKFVPQLSPSQEVYRLAA